MNRGTGRGAFKPPQAPPSRGSGRGGGPGNPLSPLHESRTHEMRQTSNPPGSGGSRPGRTESSARGRMGREGSETVGANFEGTRPPYCIGYKRLKEIAASSPLDALTSVIDPSFWRLLDDSDTFEKEDWVVLIVEVFEKVCLVNGCDNHVNASLTMLIQSEFLKACSRIPLDFQTQPSKNAEGCKLLEKLFPILKVLVTKYPGAAGINVIKAIHACQNYLNYLQTRGIVMVELNSKFSQLLTTAEEANDTKPGSSVPSHVSRARVEELLNRLHLQTPPDNFREIPIIPTSEEILDAEPPYLRPNIQKGAYSNVEHYLDVQFRLLREDFVAPLRKGLEKYMNEGQGKQHFRLQDIRVYNGVTFHRMEHDFFGVHLIFKFDVSPFSKVKWDISKRFLTGSLLCFANLDFNHLTFGTVSKRDPNDLKKGFLTVSPQSGLFDLGTWMQGEKVIIETSSAYFEAYRHVLRCLQKRSEDLFPLIDYIVYGAMKDAHPEFLPQDYNFSFITPHLSYILLRNQFGWPAAEKFCLDDSQFEAFKSALTQEFAVIQGPPGTGKTYIGLRVVETLLKNKMTEQIGPILVICYTNHALDQFLEEISKFTEDIVRIGGRSKSRNMEEFHISKWIEKNRMKRPSTSQKRISKLRGKLRGKMNTIQWQVKDYQEHISQLQEGSDLVSPETLKDMEIIDEETHHVIQQFQQWISQVGKGANLLEECRSVHAMHQSAVSKKPSAPQKTPQDQMKREKQEQLREEREEEEEEEIEDALAFEIAQRIDDSDFDVTVDVEDESPQATETDTSSSSNIIVQFEISKQKLSHEVKDTESTLQSCLEVLEPSPQEEQNINRATLSHRMACEKQEFFKAIQPLLKVDPQRILPKPKILQEDKLSKETLQQLSLHDCLELVAFWHGQAFVWIRNELAKKSRSYIEVTEEFKELYVITQLNAMKGAKVIGMTTSGAAKYQALLQNFGSKVVIVEEAAEIMEAHIVTSLPSSCQQLILIGDHQQLKPNTTDYDLAVKYHLDVSMFERAVNNGIQLKRLRVQHRMRPSISRLITPHIYPDLLDHDSVLNYPSISGMTKNLFFLTHTHKEMQEEDLRSHKNRFEAEFVLTLCQRLLRQDEYTPGDITILTTYSGQLLVFKKLLKDSYYEDCREVRCTVVDNFQGEENEIILLSLVRSNEEAKIGFLKTENRVCVALSRAKRGFYIVGNMDSLRNGSEIWKKIEEALVNQEAIGPELELQCPVHRDQIIRASQPSHFPPGGGCHMQCGMKMPCGHICQQACHSNDRTHISFKCPEISLKTIPACKHTIQVPCHLSPAKAKCKSRCISRLECGHQCSRYCHVKNDPKHRAYVCRKPCERSCNENHKCLKICGTMCPPCEVVMDRILPCGHKEKLKCHVDVSKYDCKQYCSKTLSCGHRCRLKCNQTCGQCRKPVSKIITHCGHKIQAECSSIPKEADCTQTCEKMLYCGHPCINLCKDKCTTQCQVLVPYPGGIPSCCGHDPKVPCCDSGKKMDSEELMELCDAPCSKPLPGCEHICTGKCGECWGGRLHQECSHKCGRPLLCGHVCTDKCSRSCPPCKKNCQNKCDHNHCKKKCGDPCSPCQEPCKWQCHKDCPRKQKCTKKCHEMCDREPCDQPCSLRFKKCKHPCIGLCGEKCPPLCRICNKEKLTEFQFIGNETDEDARFVYLSDCKHCIEVKAMDQYMKMEMEEIGMKKCPRCHTVIWSSMRYGNIIRQLYRNVAAVKEKAFGDPKQNQDEFLKYFQDFIQLGVSSHLQQEIKSLERSAKSKVEEIKQCRVSPHPHPIIDQFELLFFKHQKEILEKLNRAVTAQHYGISVLSRVVRRAKTIADRVLSGRRGFNDWELESIVGEVARLPLFGMYWKLQDGGVNRFPEAMEHIRKAEVHLLSLETFSDTMVEEVHRELNAASRICGELGISKQERIMISKAMNLRQGSWYKCPNGHPFANSGCGGAMEVSKCNECGAKIGGTNHQLLDDNSRAGEMDYLQ